MNKLKIILLFGLFSIPHTSYAQSSEQADTVIIIKEPVIVRKQVYAASPPALPSQNTNKKWGIEAFFMGGKPFLTSSNSTQVTSNLMYIGGLLLTRNIKNFELGIGISLFKGSFNYKSSNTASSISNLDSTYTVLLDSYIQNIGGKDTTVYITEERDTSFTRTSYITTLQSGNPSYTYIQIPIGVGYKFNLWKDKLHLIPRVQFIYGIRTHAFTDGNDSPGTSTLSYIAQLNFSYALTSYLSVLAKCQWESYFIQPYPSPTFQSFTYGAGFVVHF